jgi:hypothetical protein
MPVKDFIEYLKVLVKEEFEAIISIYGNVLVLKFADGVERTITVE